MTPINKWIFRIVVAVGMVGSVWLCIFAAGCSSQDMKTVDVLWKSALTIQNNACNGVDGEPSMADLACAMVPDKCGEIRGYCLLADIARPTAKILAEIVNGALEGGER